MVAGAAYPLLCDAGARVDERVVLCTDVNALGGSAEYSMLPDDDFQGLASTGSDVALYSTS